ncbi:hypothetical protein [Ralstonia mojiangensis]|uniref:hypothetical protein n=1 Tax=Ralstonia mojiangensis TaxID=2953895 RepID=UPI0021B3252C|nr:hypothetical protein [Ralstonia mojiangensis]MCT7328728.1 hypothetical protein [Ralstonia mojiangensis]
MSPATQVEGEIIAKQVAQRVEAEATLAEYRAPIARWQYFFWLVVGFVWGGSTGAWATHGALFIGAVAGAAFFLAAAAFRECIDLRRRLDATLVLLRSRDAF